MTMTRTYAARMLLAHGPLTRPELVEITGWQQKEVTGVLACLIRTDSVAISYRIATDRKHGSRKKTRLYALASSSNASGCASSMQATQTAATANTGSNCHG